MNCRKELADVTRTATLKEFVAEKYQIHQSGSYRGVPVTVHGLKN